MGSEEEEGVGVDMVVWVVGWELGAFVTVGGFGGIVSKYVGSRHGGVDCVFPAPQHAKKATPKDWISSL